MMPLDFLCRQSGNAVDFPCFQVQSIGLILNWLNNMWSFRDDKEWVLHNNVKIYGYCKKRSKVLP